MHKKMSTILLGTREEERSFWGKQEEVRKKKYNTPNLFFLPRNTIHLIYFPIINAFPHFSNYTH